jgi:hypothetical protein
VRWSAGVGRSHKSVTLTCGIGRMWAQQQMQSSPTSVGEDFLSDRDPWAAAKCAGGREECSAAAESKLAVGDQPAVPSLHNCGLRRSVNMRLAKVRARMRRAALRCSRPGLSMLECLAIIKFGGKSNKKQMTSQTSFPKDAARGAPAREARATLIGYLNGFSSLRRPRLVVPTATALQYSASVGGSPSDLVRGRTG